MLIAIDYDFTFNNDPEGWSAVMSLMESRGHSFICITGRREPPDFTKEPAIPCRVICSPDKMKEETARDVGLNVDVWIDDMPGTIQRCPILEL